MAETTYTYQGPPSGVSLNVKGGTRELLLFPSKTVTAASDNAWVKSAVARGHLVAQSKSAGGQASGKAKGKPQASEGNA